VTNRTRTIVSVLVTLIVVGSLAFLLALGAALGGDDEDGYPPSRQETSTVGSQA
jgi:hypothetical protein